VKLEPAHRENLLLAALVAAALVVAYLIRFGCDDAWISYIYSRSLVRGDGLTWFGDPIEGYTNFLWVLWVAGGLALGADPLQWAWAGSLASLAGALVLVYRIARLRTDNTIALAVTALCATNFTFLAFGTSGLETMLQTMLILAVAFGVERERRRETPSSRALLAISSCAALAIWTRMDSVVACAVLGVVLAAHLVKQRASIRAWACAVLPAVVLVGGWLVWKLAYYGDLVPNTAHAKVGASTDALVQGAIFVGRFLHAYLLWPLLGAVVIVAAVRRRFAARLPAAVVIAQLAYIAFVGGDFMEFRFFVPVLPMIALVIGEELLAASAHPRVPSQTFRAVALVGFLAAASGRHALTFDGIAEDKSYDSVALLGSYYRKVEDHDWSQLGRPFHDALSGTNATIACQGAGAIPYFADLPTVDQLGLNDRWIARNGDSPDYSRPGHQRVATLAYLLERRVTFVIGSTTMIRRGTLRRLPPTTIDIWIRSNFARPQPGMPDEIVMVAAPLDEERALLAWYLHPDPAITAKIEAAGWERRRLVRRR
jgi:hypothetical protein